MDYKTMNINDIIDWCKANNEVAWLKEEVAKEMPKDKNDLSKGTRKITFIEVKRDFVDKFMPELAPKAKSKKPTMYDLIASL